MAKGDDRLLTGDEVREAENLRSGPVFGIGKITDRAPVETIEVVRTELTKVGDGTEGNPLRRLVHFWTVDGELLATVDPADDVEIAPKIDHYVWSGGPGTIGRL